jgi:hypothetical protein
VLRFLWAHRSQNEVAQNERIVDASDCTVRFDSEHYNSDVDGKHWGDAITRKAVGNGQLARCLDDGLQIERDDRVTAITEALRLDDLELAERLVPAGRSMLHYATDCAQPEVILRLLNEGYLQWDEERAATAFKNLAERGRCDLMQRIFQLHSPVQEDHSCWENAWWEGLKAACSSGNLCVLKWLMEHPLGREVWDEMKRKTVDSMGLFRDAATKGQVEVMGYLYEHNIDTLGSLTVRYAVQEGQLNSVKWLVDHDMVGDQEAFSSAIRMAALFGHLAILQLFQTLDKPGGYEAVGLKRRRTGKAFSLWGGARDTIYWAASGGHVDVLEWLQANYPAKCGADAMDEAAYGGYLDAVKWLHANRAEGCTSDALYKAAEEGHFEVVKWLYENRPESRTCAAIISAFRSGHFRIAYWRSNASYALQHARSGLK